MSHWLENLKGKAPSRANRISKAIASSAPAEQQPSLVVIPPSAPVVHSCYAAISPPSGPGNRHGQVVEVFWTVINESLQLTDAQGDPNGPCVELEAGENPRVIACRLARQKWNSERSPFNRPLYYQRD